MNILEKAKLRIGDYSDNGQITIVDEDKLCYLVRSTSRGASGLRTISPDDYTVCLSSALREYETQDYFDTHFGSIAGHKLIMPIEHTPNRDYLAYHRDKIFRG